MTDKIQERTFLDTEGDQWYQRNKSALAHNEDETALDTIKRVLNSKRADISAILEIGCGNGKKVANLGNFFNAESFGVDPSEIAVKDGSVQFPSAKLQVGTASKLPFLDGQFDLVYFGFCLYLVDRGDMLKAVAEADRVLRPGGFLAILDFDPAIRHKREYHHRRGLFSYKTSYANFFTGSGHYYLVAKDSLSHTGNTFSEDSNERVSISILYKEEDAY
ncbi:class I SAM-dependent methyltransferase [Rhizobium grahamii]|uniref:Class I SAM-dependent methyltransferase n=1 Tax=Rhizobium grahamii TaxID=1120045 RepID=A0A5Q0CDZ7_9HYPH|nr:MULTISPECIES: class I SAM-dependent methyltransferase [Rhizobium]QFY62009.1 class I SAM-dependent methyltransferase [Rhizobium grahamii]QRM48814.1 class I SAM-dependent methyltransferase [Rhizobium sp. BG6]